MDNFLLKYQEMISLRGLTENTRKTYTSYLKAYFEYLQLYLHKSPEEVSWEELRQFVFYLQQQRQLSNHTINHCIKQLRFFTIYVLHKPWDPYQLPYRKIDTFLPYVPSKEEVYSFISTIHDIKLKTMVSLMYSAGLRIGEVRLLRYHDVQRKKGRIHISKTKNRSDRYAILSQNMLNLLTQYWFAHQKPEGWLFPQPRNQKNPIDCQTISRNFNIHRTQGNHHHRITCHSMRHAFGTHLYEDGIDLLTIKKLLGHKSIQSTTIYVTLSSIDTDKVISPFDKLGGDIDG